MSNSQIFLMGFLTASKVIIIIVTTMINSKSKGICQSIWNFNVTKDTNIYLCNINPSTLPNKQPLTAYVLDSTITIFLNCLLDMPIARIIP